MKTLLVVFAVVAVITAMLLGSGYVLARTGGNVYGGGGGGQAALGCERHFGTLDSGNKGYLSYWDFKDGWSGPGGHMGLAPTDASGTVFASADRNGDNQLTAQEFCEWKGR